MITNGEPLLSVKNDFVFKLIFGDERNKDILASFLNAVTKIPMDDLMGLEIISNELEREFQTDKKGVLDVRVKLRNGQQCDIEIQVVPLQIMSDRSIYYVSKMLTGQIEKGQNYNALKKCIAINIVDFYAIDLAKIHSVFHYWEDEDKDTKLSDLTEIHFLQLPYLKNKQLVQKTNPAVINWLMFINDQSQGVLEALAKEGKEMVKAIELLEIASQSEKNRFIYEARQKELMDESQRIYENRESGLKEGLERGLEQGLERGLEQGISGMVSSLLDFDIPETVILTKLQEKYNLSEPDAVVWLQKFKG